MISDRFMVLGRIGSGAVAVVYLVRHLQLSSLHAIKVLRVPTPFVQERLLREGQLQSALRDPHVVPVTDVVDVDGAPGLVMDFVRGPSLERLLQHVRLDTQQAVALGAGILAGMRSAHQAGMIHRDLKPANVLIDVTDTRLVPKVADFGLAKLLGGDDSLASTATRTGSTLGTPAYMAPEQIRDARNVDERADVFALGTILYELLTGRRVFPGDDLLELFDAIRKGEHVPVRMHAPDVPPWLEAVVEDALKVDRDERIGSVAELCDRWTQGRGEQAVEIDWSSEMIALVNQIVPRPEALSVANSPSPISATFDLGSESPPSTTLSPASDSVSPATDSEEAERGTDAQGDTAKSSPLPAALSRHPPYAAAAIALSVAVSMLFVCAGSASVVGVGLTIGWLQLGPEVPVQVTPEANRSVYSPRQMPRISNDPAVEARHESAWRATREGRWSDALVEIDALTEAVGSDDIGLLLLMSVSEIALGSSSGYHRVEQAAEIAARRPGPLPDLARIANESLRQGPDPARIRAHLTRWPDDELAIILLTRFEGMDGERRLELLNYAVARDPDAPGLSVLLAHHWLDRTNLSEANLVLDEAGKRFPDNPQLAIARARSVLLLGQHDEARRIVEGIEGTDPWKLRIHAAALRELGDIAILDATYVNLPYGDHLSRIALAYGRAEAAFGVGSVEEALYWLDIGFKEAHRRGRIDDAADLARMHQQFAALLQRPGDLSAALDRARLVTSMLGMPRGLHDRLTARILLLDGLLALEEGDVQHVQDNIQQLEKADRGERLAAILRAASLARQGNPVSGELPAGCVGRMIGAKWRSGSPNTEVDSVFAALATEEAPCARSGIDRYIRADAESLLAASAVDRGDIEDALRHIESSRRWAPHHTDLDSPLYARNAETMERIATREP